VKQFLPTEILVEGEEGGQGKIIITPA
jgi:hypothetical protein